MRWGEAGTGEWITVYTNPGHAFVVIAACASTRAPRATAAAARVRAGAALRSTRGFKARHPEALGILAAPERPRRGGVRAPALSSPGGAHSGHDDRSLRPVSD
jgi:hypothetical protein